MKRIFALVTLLLMSVLSSAQAVQTGAAQGITPKWFGADTGAVNAYVTCPKLPVTSALTKNTLVFFSPANTNTGASTLNVCGTGVFALTKKGSTALEPGAIAAGQILMVAWDAASHWQVVTSSASYPGSGIPNSTGTAWGTSFTTSGTGTVLALTASPTFTGTVNGITASMVGLGSVTNDAQTKAAIVPNTVPSAGQIHVGNAGGTAFAAVTLSGDATLSSTGALTINTLNQNTTGSAAKLTTARNIAGNSFDGSANTNFTNKFLVQGTTDAGLTGAQFLGALGTGILKNTTTTGVLSVAIAADFPTLNQNTTGTAANLAGCTPSTAGDVCYWNGSSWTLLGGNTSGTSVLQETNTGVPSWGSGGGSMVYPGAGIPVSSGTVWNSSLTVPTGALVGNGQNNTYSTGLQSFAAATMALPASASYAPTTAEVFGYDSTAKRLVFGNGTSTSFVPWFTSAPISGNCPQASGTAGLLAWVSCPTLSFTTSGSGSVIALTASPTFTGTVSGITATMVGLGSVTNDAQTKASILPNTLPSPGQIPTGNGAGNAYAAQTMSGDATYSSSGALTVTGTGGVAFSTAKTGQVYAGLNGGNPVFVSPTVTVTNIAGTSDSFACDSSTALVDRMNVHNYQSSSAVAVALPSVAATGCGAGFAFGVMVSGTGTVTFTPTTSKINYVSGFTGTTNLSSLALKKGAHCSFKSDSTDYYVTCTGIDGVTYSAISGGTNNTVVKSTTTGPADSQMTDDGNQITMGGGNYFPVKAATDVCSTYINPDLIAGLSNTVSRGPVVDFRNYTGAVVLGCSSDPFVNFNTLNNTSGTLDLTGHTLSTDVPIVFPNKFKIKADQKGDCGNNGTGGCIQASATFHTNYPTLIATGTATACINPQAPSPGNQTIVLGTNISATNSTLVRTSNVVTVTTSSAHGYSTGQWVTITNAVDSTFNGSFGTITVTGGTTYTYAQTASNASTTSGTTQSCTAGGTGTFTPGAHPASYVDYAFFGSPSGTTPAPNNTFAVGTLKTITDSQHAVSYRQFVSPWTLPAPGTGFNYAMVMPVVQTGIKFVGCNGVAGNCIGNQEKLEDITVDANDGNGVTTDLHINAFNMYGQENVWFRRIGCRSANWVSIDIETTGAQNSGPYDDNNCGGNSLATSITEKIIQTGYTRVFSGGTMTGGSVNDANILLVNTVNGGGTTMINRHLESAIDGIRCGWFASGGFPWKPNGEGCQNFKTFGISGNNAITNLFHFVNATDTPSANIEDHGSVRGGSAHLYLDETSGTPITTDVSPNGYYLMGAPTFVSGIATDLYSGAANIDDVNFTGGQDTVNATGTTLGAGIFRGADCTSVGTGTSICGGAIVRGGNNAIASTASQAGSVLIMPGKSTNATQGLQGLIMIETVYVKGATVTQWNLQQVSAAMTTADAAATPTQILGVAELVGSNTVQVVINGETPINASAAVTNGHTVCADSTASKVTDSGATTACLAPKITVGVVLSTSGGWTLKDGTTITLSTTLPLVELYNKVGAAPNVATVNSFPTNHAPVLGKGTADLSSTAAMGVDTLLQGQGSSADPVALAIPNTGPSQGLGYSTSGHTLSATGFNGLVYWVGSQQSFNAPTVTPTCAAACVATWGYTLAVFDVNGNLRGVSTQGTTAAQNVTLSLGAGDTNTVTWSSVTGCTTATCTYNVYRSQSGGTPTQLSLVCTAVATPLTCSDDGSITTATVTAGTIVGTGAAATVYTYSLPGGTIPNGKCISIKAWYAHTTGSTSTTYRLTYGGSAAFTTASAATTAASVETILCNNPGGNANQQAFGQLNGGTVNLNTTAINSASAQNVIFDFNVANTDVITPKGFVIQMVQ